MFNTEEKAGFAWIALFFALTVGLVFVVFQARSRHPPAASLSIATTELHLATLEGRIVDASTGEALALNEATITLEGLEGVSGHYLEPAPDEDPGRFFLRAIPVDADFRLRVAFAGRQSTERALRFASGDTINLGDLGLKSLVRIGARVVDLWDLPVAGATVSISDELRKVVFEQISDSKGLVESGLLPPQVFRIAADCDGHDPLPLPRLDLSNGDSVAAGSLSIRLAPLKSMQMIAIESTVGRPSAPSGSEGLRARTETGAFELGTREISPVASLSKAIVNRDLGADLLFEAPARLAVRVPSYADESDVVLLREPPIREVSVIVRSPAATRVDVHARTCCTEITGFEVFSFASELDRDVGGPIQLQLHEGTDFHLIALAADGAHAVLRNERLPFTSDGRIVPLELSLSPGNGAGPSRFAVLPVSTDDWIDKGQFDRTPAFAPPPLSMPWIAAVIDDPPDLSLARRIRASPSGSPVEIIGRVEDSAGPRPAALVSCIRWRGSEYPECEPLAEYLIAGVTNGMGEFRIRIGSAPDDSTFLRVEAAGCAVAVERVLRDVRPSIRLQKSCSAAFRVVDREGAPVRFAKVRLQLPSAYARLPMERPRFQRMISAADPDRQPATGCVDAVSDANGELRVDALPCGDFTVIDVERFQYRLAKAVDFSLGPGEFRRVDDVLCERSFAVLGRVGDADGRCIESPVVVTMETPSGSSSVTTPVDSEGRFLFTGASALPVTIRAESQGYETVLWQCAAIPTEFADIRLPQLPPAPQTPSADPSAADRDGR